MSNAQNASTPTATNKSSGMSSGNPVFEYRAGFRKVAGAVQRWAIRLGLLTAAVCLLALLFGEEGPISGTLVRWTLFGALLVVVSGFAWGFMWRSWVRAAFRKEYGSKVGEASDAAGS